MNEIPTPLPNLSQGWEEECESDADNIPSRPQRAWLSVLQKSLNPLDYRRRTGRTASGGRLCLSIPPVLEAKYGTNASLCL